MSTSLTLGAFTFSDFAIPPNINGGGDQKIAAKDLVGGQRIVDVMGIVQDDISFSGLFLESQAEEKMKLLDGFRTAGLPLPLIYSLSVYLVTIKTFKWVFDRNYQIHYSITCTVIQDLTNPISDFSFSSYNDAISGLQTQANSLSSSIGNPNITNAMSSVNSSIAAVPSIQDATTAQLASVEAPTQNAIDVTGNEITTLNNATFSGGVSSDVIAENIETLSEMYELQNVLIKMLDDFTLVEEGATGQQVIVNGGSLYKIAAKYYRNALLWTGIAEANNLSDPQLPANTTLTLVIPANPTNTGGVLTS